MSWYNKQYAKVYSFDELENALLYKIEWKDCKTLLFPQTRLDILSKLKRLYKLYDRKPSLTYIVYLFREMTVQQICRSHEANSLEFKIQKKTAGLGDRRIS